MITRCDFEYVEITEDIVFIRDTNKGKMSVTNDADEVYRLIHNLVFPGRRVVYMDSTGEWWEIVPGPDHNWPTDISVAFKQWHGKVWDALTT
jgi:predicted transcriptional regulator